MSLRDADPKHTLSGDAAAAAAEGGWMGMETVRA
jgi:hypothetical protein